MPRHDGAKPGEPEPSEPAVISDQGLEATQYLLPVIGTDHQITEQYAQAALRELSTMWLYHAGLPPADAARKASPHIARLLREHPRDGRGRLYHMEQQMMENGILDDGDVDAFLEVADAGDPVQRRAIEAFRKTRSGP